MTCTWCSSEAITGAERPPGVTGRQYLFACAIEKHQKLIDRLGYERKDLSTVAMAIKREQKEAKK